MGAFAEPAQLAAWWSNGEQGEIRAGAEGSWLWPSEGGRFAYRIEAVEAPRYLCWTWVGAPDVSLEDAEQVLRTEWVLVPREDGGTDLHLLETGFTGPDSMRENEGGWEQIIPSLRKHLGEA